MRSIPVARNTTTKEGESSPVYVMEPEARVPMKIMIIEEYKTAVCKDSFSCWVRTKQLMNKMVPSKQVADERYRMSGEPK